MRRRVRFEFQAQRVDFFGLFRRHRPHEKAAIGMQHDQAILLQARQCFPQRNFADSQFGGVRVLPDRQLRADGSRQNEVAHDLDQSI